MTDDAGTMSIDFMAGFTIFILVFIWVATMVPSLFIGLNTYTVDYDAVAYRTAVILVEDPGAADPAVTGPWEIQPDKRDVIRFGLARSKETPNILDERKVERFFCSTAFSYPEDYQQRVIFGDYPYRFNISYRVIGEDQIHSVGDIIPDGYGYIRRDVKIRVESNATIDEIMINARNYKNSENASWNHFSIQLNNTELLSGEVRNPIYQINYYSDRIIVNITDIDTTRASYLPLPAVGLSPGSNLTAINFYQRAYGSTTLSSWPSMKKYYQNLTYIDGNTSSVQPPFDVRKNISLVFEPGFFSTMDPTATMFINLTFGMYPPQQFLNNTGTAPFSYNYSAESVTQPSLKDAVLEVAVW
jgi:hypothetical protein